MYNTIPLYTAVFLYINPGVRNM